VHTSEELKSTRLVRELEDFNKQCRGERLAVSYLIVTQPDLIFEMVHTTRKDWQLPRMSEEAGPPH